jgi:hypothetical protein
MAKAKPKKPHAQIRWHIIKGQSTGADAWSTNEFEWNILVIERADRISQLLQRVYETTYPVGDNVLLGIGYVPDTDLSYELRSLTSTGFSPSEMAKSEQLRTIPVKQDKDLRQRKTRDTLPEYVESHIKDLASR